MPVVEFFDCAYLHVSLRIYATCRILTLAANHIEYLIQRITLWVLFPFVRSPVLLLHRLLPTAVSNMCLALVNMHAVCLKYKSLWLCAQLLLQSSSSRSVQSTEVY
jgi:hypothetical protein